ncbi:MAG: hypothetical protein U0234_10720 [Sandaracinus sp.]
MLLPYRGARVAFLLWPTLATVLVLVLVGSAPRAHAQDDARASAAARALFQEGVTCADAEDWACAAERFTQAARLRASPVILSNQGVALMHLGRLVEASEAFRTVMRDATASAALHADAERYVAEIEPRLGRLTLALEGPGEGVVVTVDGQDHTSLVGLPAPCDPGSHEVLARRDGEVLARATVEVTAGATASTTLAIPPRPVVATVPDPNETVASTSTAPDDTTADLGRALAPDPAPTDSHPEIYEEWWLWTIVGVVVVGTAVGVGVGVATSNPGTTLPMGTLGVIDTRM